MKLQPEDCALEAGIVFWEEELEQRPTARDPGEEAHGQFMHGFRLHGEQGRADELFINGSGYLHQFLR